MLLFPVLILSRIRTVPPDTSPQRFLSHTQKSCTGFLPVQDFFHICLSLPIFGNFFICCQLLFKFCNFSFLLEIFLSFLLTSFSRSSLASSRSFFNASISSCIFIDHQLYGIPVQFTQLLRKHPHHPFHIVSHASSLFLIPLLCKSSRKMSRLTKTKFL